MTNMMTTVTTLLSTTASIPGWTSINLLHPYEVPGTYSNNAYVRVQFSSSLSPLYSYVRNCALNDMLVGRNHPELVHTVQ